MLRNSIYYWVFPYTFVVIILSLVPVPNLKIPEFDLFQPDKLVHLSMYFIMLFGWVKSKFFNESELKFKSLIFVFVISFSTEILQGTSFIKRYFEIADLVASKPYILMTLSILDKLGIKNKFENNKISVHPCDKIKDITVNVESDWSSVSYFYSIIAISKKSHLEIGSYFKNSIQGDKKLVEIYSKLGVKTEFIENKIFLEKDTECLLPKNLDLDLTENPDIAQTIAVTCFGLGISCNIKGLHTLKIKETDRLVALKNEIEKLGGKIEITDNSLKLYPSFEIKKNISIKTYNDHRMAMAFAPLSLLVPIYIENPDVVTKSYKNFWSDLRAINFEISR